MNWHSPYIFDKRYQIGRLRISAKMRSSNGLMGRFGGGWQWKLGLQLGSSTLIVSLLVMELIFSIRKRDEAAQ